MLQLWGFTRHKNTPLEKGLPLVKRHPSKSVGSAKSNTLVFRGENFGFGVSISLGPKLLCKTDFLYRYWRNIHPFPRYHLRMTNLTNTGTGATQATLSSSIVVNGSNDPASQLLPGQRFDRFLIRKLLGTGGMGEVYLAEQQQPLVRDVALKILKAPNLSARDRVFFDIESQTLARMRHPNVAQILEVGEANAQNGSGTGGSEAGGPSTGIPYIAMEFVEGARIHEYCDGARLDINSRLRLFLDVLKGVQHAHQKGVIHRDLKPSNIIVALLDGRALPKLIDFGIATSAHKSADGMRDHAGTPDYMSPEQAGLDADAAHIDTRSDIYSLGVVLYELLTGALPYIASARAQPGTQTKTIRRAEAVLDSMTQGDINEIALTRRLSVDALKRAVRGDLSFILWRAIQLDRSLRYETADAFAADISRYLDHRMVLAAPYSTRRAAFKWVRRNQLAVALGSITAFGLAAGAGVAIHEYQRAQTERDAANAARALAEREARASDAVADFMTEDLLAQSDVNASGEGAKITVLDAIRRANKDLGERLNGQPDVEGRVRYTLGVTLKNLTEFSDAEPQLRKAYDLLSVSYGPDSQRALQAYIEIGQLQLRIGDFAKAKSIWNDGYQRALKAFGTDDPLTLNYVSQLAVLAWQMQDIDEGIALSEAALKSPTLQKSGEHYHRAVLILNNLGRLYRLKGKFAEAERAHKEAIKYRENKFGKGAFATLEAVNDLAGLYRQMKRLDESAAMYRAIIAGYRESFGNQHASTATALNNLGRVLADQGKLIESLDTFAQAYEVAVAVGGVDSYLAAAIDSNWGKSLLLNDQAANALPRFERAAALFAKQLPEKHRQRVDNLVGLERAYRRLGRNVEADTVLGQISGVK